MDTFFKKRIFILGINTFFCVAVFIVSFLFIKNIFDKQKKIDDIKSKIEMLKNNSEIIKTQTKKLDSLNQKEIVLEGLILTKENAPRFFSTIENIAEKNNTKVSILNVDDVVKDNKKTLNLDVHITGSLFNIQNFYKGLQSLPVQILVESIVLEKDQEVQGVSGAKNVSDVSNWSSQSSLVVLSY